MSILKELLALNEASNSEFAGFNEKQVRDIEDYIGDAFDDAVEVTGILPSRESEDGNYNAFIVYDGTNDKENKGHVFFTAEHNGKDKVSDFKIVNFTGRNYRKSPSLNEALNEAAEPMDVAQLAKSIVDEINRGGTRIFDVEMYDDDDLHFAIEFDFSEGFITSAEIKKASKLIKSVKAQKAPQWRNGQTGADYNVIFKTAMSDEDQSKLVAAIKKATKK